MEKCANVWEARLSLQFLVVFQQPPSPPTHPPHNAAPFSFIADSFIKSQVQHMTFLIPMKFID